MVSRVSANDFSEHAGRVKKVTRSLPPSATLDPLTLDIDTPETYRIGLVRIDVRAAKRILTSKKRRPLIYQCGLNRIADLVRRSDSQKPPDGTFVVSASEQYIDWDRISSPSIDLSVPVLLARLPRDLGGLWPIDGWHRIAKAVDNHLNSLPCYILSARDSLRIIDRPDN